MLEGGEWFDAAQGQTPPEDSDQAKAAFILCPDMDWLIWPGILIEPGERD
jgi:hypothetical protein